MVIVSFPWSRSSHGNILECVVCLHSTNSLFSRSPISLMFIFLLCSYVAVYMQIFCLPKLLPFSLQLLFFFMTSSHFGYILRRKSDLFKPSLITLEQSSIWIVRSFEFLLYCLLAPFPEKWGRERKHFIFFCYFWLV